MQRSSESRMLIDGKLVPASDGATYANINPATEEVLGRVADATDEDVDAAIAAARRAFDETGWATDTQLRIRCLRQLQAALESEKEELRAELVAEVGTPVMVTGIAQLEWPLAHSLNYYAGLIEKYAWERELPDSDLFGVHSVRRVWKEAVGVVSAIIPWNFPFEVLMGKLAPALAAGNTIVVKSAIETPFNALRIGRLIAEATDIPAGVVNIVTTSDNAIAERLVRDPRVDMVSFTGSTAVGRHIQQVGADSVKRVFLELGGKSAMVVLDDADLATVIPASAQACMHAGQGCALTTRLLVPRSRYAEAVAIATAVYQNIPYGDPADPQTFSGPLISQKQRERVLGMIEQGKKEGARVAVGGGVPEHLRCGYYVQPTLFVDVDNSMSIAQQEIFGPVLAVIAYDDAKGDAEAVRVANDSPYGLSGAVFSASQDRALAVARQLRTGSIGVNGGMFYGADAPYGGYKASGVGRQNGVEGLEQYLETKTIGYAAG
jgi:aldehyde dehydrogenase (NAD+)